MKRSSRELKRIARDLLNNRYNVPMGAFVTASLITAVIEIPFSLSFNGYLSTSQIVISLLANYLILLIGLVLHTGILFVHLNMTRGKVFKLTQVFEPFFHNTERYFLSAFFYSLLILAACIPMAGGSLFCYFYFNENRHLAIPVFIFTMFLSVLLFIWFSLNYSLVFFLLPDKPQMKVSSLFKESRLIMKKNKGRLFYLLLSFLPWSILRFCSFGIASLWICPYVNQTLINFYLDCTGELNHIPVRNYAAGNRQFTDLNS